MKVDSLLWDQFMQPILAGAVAKLYSPGHPWSSPSSADRHGGVWRGDKCCALSSPLLVTPSAQRALTGSSDMTPTVKRGATAATSADQTAQLAPGRYTSATIESRQRWPHHVDCVR